MKRKKILALIFATLLFTVILLTTVTASPSLEHTSEYLAVDTSDTVLAQDEHPAFTQADLNDNFINYAAGESRVVLPVTYSVEDGANVVGTVLEKETGQPISNATIAVDGDTLVTTDSTGRFQICNVPNGTYTWNVSASGYQDACYLNYTVDWLSGTDIFTFEISKTHEIIIDRLELWTCDDLTAETVHMDEAQQKSVSSITPTSIPPVSASVRVEGYSKPIPRQQYIYSVIRSELYDENWYMRTTGTRTNVLTSAQLDQLYIIQALVANTYLQHALSVEGNHDEEPFDVCATTCCQKYDPRITSQRAVRCSAMVFSGTSCNVLFYTNNNGTLDYALCQFFSSCYNAGTQTSRWHPEMVATTCQDFDTGHGGHRFGMCQMGAAELARLNYGNADIRTHYYTSCIPYRCNME